MNSKYLTYLKFAGVALGIILFTAIGRKIWLTFFPKPLGDDSKMTTAEKVTKDALSETLDVLIKKAKAASLNPISLQDAKNYAGQLEICMNGIGTGFYKQREILSGLQSKLSCKIVEAAFGVRDYSVFGFMPEYLTLRQWWARELMSDDLKTLESFL